MVQTLVVAGAGPSGGLAGHDNGWEDVGILEDLLGVAEIDNRFDPRLIGEKSPERLAVAGLEPLVGDDERQAGRPVSGRRIPSS